MVATERAAWKRQIQTYLPRGRARLARAHERYERAVRSGTRSAVAHEDTAFQAALRKARHAIWRARTSRRRANHLRSR